MTAAEKVKVVVEGEELTITNPDKLLWPESGITKMEYIERLTVLSPYLIPYLENRHLTTIRYPDGIHGEWFYQKNCPEPKPHFVKTAPLENISYVNADSLPTLVWLGNLACLEFHPSLHYIGNTLPAEWIIDIDPSRDPEPRLMEAVLRVGELLDSLHIHSVPKTSGASGMQIWIPIQRRYAFEQLRKIGQFLAHYLAEKHPETFTVERLKKDRGQKIYIDYLQHWYGKTLSAPYTPRARTGAPVSAPLKWEEVELKPRPEDFHLRNMSERLKQTGDLIASVPPQSLDPILTFLDSNRYT